MWRGLSESAEDLQCATFKLIYPVRNHVTAAAAVLSPYNYHRQVNAVPPTSRKSDRHYATRRPIEELELIEARVCTMRVCVHCVCALAHALQTWCAIRIEGRRLGQHEIALRRVHKAHWLVVSSVYLALILVTNTHGTGAQDFRAAQRRSSSM